MGRQVLAPGFKILDVVLDRGGHPWRRLSVEGKPPRIRPVELSITHNFGSDRGT
jgi:hypothetical protein